MTYIVQAVEATAAVLRKGQLVILESTTYPGTTDEVVQPTLEARASRPGEDFFLAFSPERVDPGNPQYQTKNIPKVVGGINEDSTERARGPLRAGDGQGGAGRSTERGRDGQAAREHLPRRQHRPGQRAGADVPPLGIDVWEVIDAAKTKPFGFMPFYPGPGLGGHCIPIDPFYLSWKARQ